MEANLQNALVAQLLSCRGSQSPQEHDIFLTNPLIFLISKGLTLKS